MLFDRPVDTDAQRRRFLQSSSAMGTGYWVKGMGSMIAAKMSERGLRVNGEVCR